MMLGVQRPTVTVVLRALKRDGLISSRYGRIQILHRKRLERLRSLRGAARSLRGAPCLSRAAFRSPR